MTLYAKIQPLQDGNIRAKICDGRDHHAVHVHKEIQRIRAMARKGKATYARSGKENSKPQVGKEISKLTLTQRAGQEQEGILKQSTARQSKQHLVWDTMTQPLHELNIRAAREEHCANIGNNVRIREISSAAVDYYYLLLDLVLHTAVLLILLQLICKCSLLLLWQLSAATDSVQVAAAVFAAVTLLLFCSYIGLFGCSVCMSSCSGLLLEAVAGYSLVVHHWFLPAELWS
ncbi:hypothetical protein RHGRI_023988 [Rhododendron griersonianum]|uniref:Uncharacterized protein n=1 Tax=Rhododendron griersonianum TaxID=479676 RepID=A0AAV6JA27_9ERIC|nr:hypothetical protein RHGRI_023988 [Rhododendron griersonianum]